MSDALLTLRITKGLRFLPKIVRVARKALYFYVRDEIGGDDFDKGHEQDFLGRV